MKNRTKQISSGIGCAAGNVNVATYSSKELDLILSFSAFSHGCKGALSDSAGSAPLVDISIQLIHSHKTGRVPQHVSVKPVCLRPARRPAEECVSASARKE